MRRLLAVVSAFASAAAVLAQTTPKLEPLLSLDGQFLADFAAADAFFLRPLAIAQSRRTPGSAPADAAAVRLNEAATSAFFSSQMNAASRLFARLLLHMRGQQPGEWSDLAHSLRFHLDRRLAAPGAIVHASLAPAFRLSAPFKKPYTVRLVLLDEKAQPVYTAPLVTLDRIEDQDVRLPTRGLPEGTYHVRYSLHDSSGLLLLSASRPLTLNAAAMRRLEALESQADAIAARGIARQSPRHAAAVETVLATAELYRRATREYVGSYHQMLHPLLLSFSESWPEVDSTDPIQPGRDLALAESLAAPLLNGGDPLAGRTGDLHLAYRSGVEKPFQPYRVFAPSNYDPARKWPLIVALRSDTGDEGTLFERCPAGGPSILLKLAQERGYIVVSPEGLGAYSYFVGTSADDVFRSVDAVRAIFSIDEQQIFAAGNAMGGMGAISLSLDARSRFAAVAAVSVSPLQRHEYARAPARPLLLLQPSASRIMTLREARAFGFLMAKHFKQFDYDELPQQDHFSAFPAALPRIFDFFDAVRAGRWKPSGKPIPLPEPGTFSQPR